MGYTSLSTVDIQGNHKVMLYCNYYTDYCKTTEVVTYSFSSLKAQITESAQIHLNLVAQLQSCLGLDV